MSVSKILIVEDEPKIARLLEEYLQQANFETHWLDHGGQAIPWIEAHQPDLVLLDLMLPEKDGLQICRQVREFSDMPIIMLTARVEEIDRLLGLELGADDYICKPFSPREVVARVRVILRRVARITACKQGYRGLTIDNDRHEVLVGEQVLDLTPVEFRLLCRLSVIPGHVFSREQLKEIIYLDGRVVSDRTVDSHVKNLRKKMRSVFEDDCIHSIYGIGYKFE